MKLNTNFFAGLSFGLLLGIVLFNASSLQSSTNTPNATSTAKATHQTTDAIKGDWISIGEANALTANYSATVALGGFVGKKNLRDVVGLMGDGDIKYRFYQEAGANGTNKIGLLFYPSENSQTVLKTGNAAFCPMLCEYP